MNMNQIISYAALALILIAAIAQGVSVALNFYMKKMAEQGKKVPSQVVTAKEAADALYSEANQILNVTGAEKKAWAVSELQKQKPNLTDSVAKGMIQKAYDDAQAANATDQSTDTEVSQIGFVDQSDQGSDNND